MKLTNKEQKLLWLDRHLRRHPSKSHTVGDYCRILHTTAITLLGKTEPSLKIKCEERNKQAICKRLKISEADLEELLKG
jgi:hypothetical protein